MGALLVAAQVALCVLLIGRGWPGMAENPWLWIGVGIGTAVGASGIWAMRWSQVKITPEPGHAAELCERGIYRFIRHPMYSGLLLGMTMFAAAAGGWAGWVLWAGLAMVLWCKIRIEERLWSERDPAYREYRKRTRRIIPWIF